MRPKASPHSSGALLVGTQWRPCAAPGPGPHRAVVVKDRMADETGRELAVLESRRVSGLNDIWIEETGEQGGDDGAKWPFWWIKAEEAEKALVDAAESVLRDTVDGVPPAHLFACAEVPRRLQYVCACSGRCPAFSLSAFHLRQVGTQHQHLSLITLRLCLQCALHQHLSLSSSRF